MGISREVISSKVFRVLLMDIFSLYKKELQGIVKKDQDDEICKAILDHENEEIFKPRRGYSKHIFARKDTNEYYYSIGAVISNALESIKKKPEIDLSDFIYKKCIAYNNNDSVIEVYNTFFQLLGYKNIKEYCASKKDLEYDQATVSKYRKSVKNHTSNRIVRLENRLRGTWWLYFYNNEGFGKPSLARATLDIKDLYNLRLTNATTKSSINYTGKIDDSMNNIAGIVYLKFSPDNKWENRNLRIAMHISADLDVRLAVGHYTNIDSGGHLIRGSIGMLRIDESELRAMKEGKARSSAIQDLDDVIPEFKAFFNDKNLSFNRLPINQYNLDSFRNWLGEQKAKRHYRRTKRINENKKLFISCPINSVSPQQFQELKGVVKEVEKFFKKEGFTHVNSFINELEEQKDKTSIPDRIEYQKVMTKFEACSFHMAIWPRDLKPSGIIFEIGWAVMKGRPIVIFEQVNEANSDISNSQIPHLLLGASLSKGSGIERYTFQQYDEIVKILDNNQLSDIFINPTFHGMNFMRT